MKALIAIAATILAVIALAGLARIAAALADNKAAKPENAVKRYEASDGSYYFRVNVGINNAYLLPCDGGWLLVDTGYPEDYERFKAALSAAGVSLSDIRHLFITHAHDEHAGFAAALVRDTACRLVVPAESVPDLKRGLMVWNGKAITRRIEAAAWLYDIVKRRDMRFPPVEMRAGDIVLEGEADAGAVCPGIRGRFIPTPGHSPDSYSLILDDGRAFVGDSAMNYLNALGADYRPIFVTDEAMTYRSLERILTEGATTLYTGHGHEFGADEGRRIVSKYGAETP